MSRSLPFPERVLHQHSATLGKTGAGKSSALRVIVEDLLANKKRVVVIDPKGDWWGLKASADGRGAGFPVILFGSFKNDRAADVPLNPRSGKDIAELIATGNRPAVIGLRGWMPGELTKFWLDFAPALFNRNEGELYVVIDEVHNFAPKGKIMDPDSGKCLHWTNRILSEGRGLGLTFHIASQRAQKVHNDTLDNCETLIAMRTAHPAARQSIKDWIDGNGDPEHGKEVLATLAQLKRGEAWIWSPENGVGPIRVAFPMFATFDSFAPPQLQKKVNQAGWSEIDLDQVKVKLAAVIAEKEANDPDKLKAEIFRLRRELAKPIAAAPAAADPKEIERAVAAATAPLMRQLERLQETARTILNKSVAELLQFRDVVSMDPPKIQIHFPPPAARPAHPKPAPTARTLPAPAAAENNGSLESGQKAVLLAAAQAQPASREALTALTGYRRSTRNRYIQHLQKKGFVIDEGGKILPTSAGMAALGSDFTPLPTGIELQRYWLDRLPKGQKEIFAAVLEHGGAAVDRETITAAVGLERSTRNRYIQHLQARQLLEPGVGAVKPAAILFDRMERTA